MVEDNQSGEVPEVKPAESAEVEPQEVRSAVKRDAPGTQLSHLNDQDVPRIRIETEERWQRLKLRGTYARVLLAALALQIAAVHAVFVWHGVANDWSVANARSRCDVQGKPQPGQRQ